MILEFSEIPVFKVNIIGPDQKLCSISDTRLNGLKLSQLVMAVASFDRLVYTCVFTKF